MHNFWLSCLGYFEKELSAQQFNTWIKPLYLDLSHTEHEPILVAPNRFVMQWIKDHFLSRIEQMAEKHFSRSIHFQLKLANQDSTKETAPAANNAMVTPIPTAFDAPVRLTPKTSKEKNPSRLNGQLLCQYRRPAGDTYEARELGRKCY